MKASVEISDWKFDCNARQAICGHCGYRTDFTNATPHCPICGARLLNYVDAPCTSYHIENGQSICWGTKEKEPCGCGGDKRLCDFYY